MTIAKTYAVPFIGVATVDFGDACFERKSLWALGAEVGIVGGKLEDTGAL